MTLKRGRFREDAFAVPIERAEMDRQSEPRQTPCCRRSAPHAQWNLIVHSKSERRHEATVSRQHVFIEIQYQVVFQPAAAIGIASRRADRKRFGSFGFY